VGNGFQSPPSVYGRVRIAADKELLDLNREGQRTIQSPQSLSRLTGSWKVCFLDYLQGVILRNGMRHLEAGRWHTDLALKREKQADRISRRAAAVLASARPQLEVDLYAPGNQWLTPGQ
jgi:hypothetical protein